MLFPQALPQNRSLETVPICIVWRYFPHNSTVCIHMCDEQKILIDSGVCHKLWSILWSIVQVCSLTIEYQDFQYVPRKAFQNNLRAYFWQFSHGFQFFFFEMMVVNAWSCYFVELLSRLVCQLTISSHTLLGMTFHVLGPWREKLRFSEHGHFSVDLAEILDSNMVR